MEYYESHDTQFEPTKVDKLIDLAVREALKNDDLLLDYVTWPDIWLDDKLPRLLKKINGEHKLVPMTMLGSEHHVGSLLVLRNAFRDQMDKMRKIDDAKQGKRRSEDGG